MRSLACKAWDVKARCPSIKSIEYSRQGEIKNIKFMIEQYVYNYTIIFDTIYRESGFGGDDISNIAKILNDVDKYIDPDKKCEDCIFNHQRKLDKCEKYYFIKNKCKEDGNN